MRLSFVTFLAHFLPARAQPHGRHISQASSNTQAKRVWLYSACGFLGYNKARLWWALSQLKQNSRRWIAIASSESVTPCTAEDEGTELVTLDTAATGGTELVTLDMVAAERPELVTPSTAVDEGTTAHLRGHCRRRRWMGRWRGRCRSRR